VRSEYKYKVRRILWHKFHCVTIPNKSSISTVRNKIRHRVIIRQKRAESKCHMLIQEKLDEICARLEYSSQKIPRILVQETRFNECFHKVLPPSENKTIQNCSSQYAMCKVASWYF
jgi:hypothetical protein